MGQHLLFVYFPDFLAKAKKIFTYKKVIVSVSEETWGTSDDLKLKAILRKYRQLPGVVNVRMDRQMSTVSNVVSFRYYKKKLIL